MLSSQDHIVVFSEVDRKSSNKYNTCTSFYIICAINCMNSSDAVLFHTVHLFVALDTVTGTKSRMNVVSCSAVHLCQLPRASNYMTVYHSTSYSVLVVSIVQLPMYVI